MKDDFNRFMWLWFGQLLSQIGNGMTIFGLGVYVYLTTGNAGNVALITLAGFLPILLLTPFSGIFVDRYDRRLLMMLGDSLSISGLFYILIVLRSGTINPWHICIGLGLSSTFSSLVEPAYRATVSDMLSPEKYTKASGLVQIASASKFLISPALAGLILTHTSIETILMLDASTFIITAITSLLVSKSMGQKTIKTSVKYKSIILEMREGWLAVTKTKGIFMLVVLGMLLTFAIGFIQVLAGPLLLTFTNELVLGYAQTVMAFGMLIASIIISSISIRNKHTVILVASIVVSATGMIMFPVNRNIVWVTSFGFLFFASLPFINACIDYLIRINIDNKVQGRAWGIIGLISQFGYLIAYVCIGILADRVFEPLMDHPVDQLAIIQKVIGVGKGSGIALMIIIGGVSLLLLAVLISREKSIYRLEEGKVYD